MLLAVCNEGGSDARTGTTHNKKNSHNYALSKEAGALSSEAERGRKKLCFVFIVEAMLLISLFISKCIVAESVKTANV